MNTKLLAGGGINQDIGKYCHCGDDCNTSCICSTRTKACVKDCDCNCNIGLNLSDANAHFHSNYTFLSNLCAGSFGLVYKVKENKSSITYATKKIYKYKRNKIGNNTFLRTNIVNVTLEDMKREVRCLMKLDHECIVKMIDFFYDDERYYLIEEYIAGGDLFEKLSKKRNYKEEDARILLKSLLVGVQYMHSKNIVHRDIKIENLLSIEKNGQVIAKIVDFGSATELPDNGRCLQQYERIGTLQYLAPEIIECRPYGKEVDMWAIGVLTYVILSGKFPYRSTLTYENSRITSEQLKLLDEKKIRNLISISKFDYIPERTWNNISDKAKRFIASLLEKDQDKRLNADQALNHEWMIDPKTLDNEIPDSLAEITNTFLKRKATSVIVYYIFKFILTLKYRAQKLIKKRKANEISEEK